MSEYFPHRPAPPSDAEASGVEPAQRFEFLADPELEAKYRDRLDRVCELARELFDVRGAFVSMVFGHEPRVVTKSDISTSGIALDHTFCRYAMQQDGVMIVQDTRADARFADTPMLTGPPQQRFYAGVSLRYEGERVGCFCVVDERPRELSVRQTARFESFSQLIVEHLETLVELNDLREQSVLLRQTERIAEVGGWVIDVDEGDVRWSSELYTLHGVDPTVRITYDMLPQFYPNGETERLTEAFTNSLSTGESFEIEITYVTTAGVERRAKLLAEVEPRVGRAGRLLGTFRDITEQRDAEAQRERAQLFDSLTGLANRTRLERRLAELALPPGCGTLVMLGLDGFKALNDANGRADCDRVLRAVATSLVGTLAADSIIARIGGDEFAIVIPGALSGLEILQHEKLIGAAVAAAMAQQPRRLACTASMGIAVFPQDASRVEAILQAAEFALRSAKASGGRRVEYFAPGMRSCIAEKILLLEDVRRGLGAAEFLLYYQPICGSTGLARGFEALMRWNHPLRGLLTPHHFMVAFDDPELSLALGVVALEQALAQIRAWSDADLLRGAVAVNLSGTQLAQADFADEVERLLKKHGVSPNRLMLEITESVYLDGDRDRLSVSLARLRGLGVSFALDDFGTGYASLSHLRQFAVDRIKIDQSFVREIGKSRDSGAIIRAMVFLGQAIGLQVVAEGVESAEQLAFLSGVGCDLIQGYYFARPMPSHEAGAFCRVTPRDEELTG